MCAREGEGAFVNHATASAAEIKHTRRISWPLVAALSVPVALLLAHAAHYMPFVADDALISLRYADRLLAGDGLSWTGGPPVEGYSNLLWILLDAALGLVGVDLIDGVRILGVGSTIGALWAIYRLSSAGPGGSPLTSWVAGGAFVLCGPVAIWAIGGLEQPLVACLIALAGVGWARIDGPRSALWAGLPLGLLCLTRPDGALIAGLFGLVHLLAGRLRRRAWIEAVALGAWAVGLTLAQLALRLAYYGDWVPNTAHLKASWSSVRFAEGVEYVVAGLESNAPLALLALLGLYAALLGHRRREAALWITIPVVWLGYVASVGGDIFPGYRHLLPALICFALLGAQGVAWALEGLSRPRQGAWALMAVALLYGHYSLQGHDFANQRAEIERWEWDGLTMGPVLARALEGEEALLAVTAAGSLPYFSKLPSLDMQGLNDRHIALQPPQPGAWLAHDHGDGPYVLDQRPDLMVFGGVIGGPPKFVSGSQMLRDKRLKRDYRMVTLEGFEPHLAQSKPWVRLDGALGIKRGEGAVEIPPHLLAGAVGQPVPGRPLGGRLPADEAVSSPSVELAPGRWRLEIEPPLPVTATVVNQGAAPILIGGGVIQLDRPGRIALRLEAVGADMVIRRVAWVKAEAGRATSPLPPKGEGRLQTGRSKDGPVVKVIGAFDEGLDGWQVEGDAFEGAPHRGPHGKYRKRQKGLLGYKGGLLNSYHPRLHDEATGRAVSPTFVPEAGQILSFALGGGSGHVALRLEDVTEAPTAVMAWTGAKDERLKRRRLDLSAFAGRTLRLVLVDADTKGWGHVTLDGVRLVSTRR